MARFAEGVRSVGSVSWLFVRSKSLVPAGGVTVAVLSRVPVASGATTPGVLPSYPVPLRPRPGRACRPRRPRAGAGVMATARLWNPTSREADEAGCGHGAVAACGRHARAGLWELRRSAEQRAVHGAARLER